MPKLSPLSLSLAACFALPALAHAQAVVVDPVVITTSILPSEMEHVPGSTAVIDEKELEAPAPVHDQGGAAQRARRTYGG